jgi:hypothetical protein
MTISITDADGAILRDVLDAKLADLRREISHTDSRRFRGALHEVEDALQRLLAQLPADVAARP